MFYGDKEGPSLGKYPAIVDTGSSNLGVPSKAFSFLKDSWSKGVKDLDCVIDDNFCQSMHSCAEVAKNVSTIGIQMGGQVFEMKPDMYLH